MYNTPAPEPETVQPAVEESPTPIHRHGNQYTACPSLIMGKMTRMELSRASGVDPALVTKIFERDAHGNPSPKYVPGVKAATRIALALGCTLHELAEYLGLAVVVVTTLSRPVDSVSTISG